MTKQAAATTESTTLLAAVQSATAADLDTVRNRIDELKKELDALNAVEKIVDIRLNGRPQRAPAAKTARGKTELAQRIFDDIAKNGPGTPTTIAKRTGLESTKVAISVARSAWFLRDANTGVVSIAKVN